MRYLLICCLFISLARAESTRAPVAPATGPSAAVPMTPEPVKTESPSKMLLVSAPEFIGVKNENLKLFMSKIAIDVLMRTNQYQLVFTLSNDPLKSRLPIYRLEMGVSTTDEQNYNIKFDVVDLANKKIVSTATTQNVPRRLLLLQTRMSLYELFLGKSYVEQNMKKIDQEDQKKKLPVESPHEDPSSQSDKNNPDHKNGDLQKKKDRNRDTIKDSHKKTEKSKDDLEIEKNQKLQEEARREDNQIIEQRLAEIRKLEQLRAQINTELLAEKHSDQEISAGSAPGPQKADAQTGQKSPNTSEPVDRRTDKNEQGHISKGDAESRTKEKLSASNSDHDKKSVLESNENGRPTEAPRYNYRALPSSFLLEVEFMNRTITSTYILTVINNLSYMGPKLSYRKEFIESNHDAVFLSLSNLKSVKSKDEEAMPLPPIIDFDVMYDKAIQFMPLDVLLGLSYERSYFINMESPGKGYKMSKNDWLWVKGGPEIGHKIYFIDYYIQFYYAKIISGKSDFIGNNQLKFDGNKYGVGFDLGLFGSLRFGARMEKDTIMATTDSKFTLTQNSFLFRATYVF